jgi:hypothetical protein
MGNCGEGILMSVVLAVVVVGSDLVVVFDYSRSFRPYRLSLPLPPIVIQAPTQAPGATVEQRCFSAA